MSRWRRGGTQRGGGGSEWDMEGERTADEGLCLPQYHAHCCIVERVSVECGSNKSSAVGASKCGSVQQWSVSAMVRARGNQQPPFGLIQLRMQAMSSCDVESSDNPEVHTAAGTLTKRNT